MQISADALFQRAARLPRVDMKKPCEVIGRTTVGAIESGLYYGYVGLVDGLVRRMRGRAGPERRVHRDRRARRHHRAGSGSHRACRSRPDAAGTENGVGEKQTTVTHTQRGYCREIEAYLCRKNDGHLIRIVGPSFERVCSWAAQGIPFKIACQGIDTCFVRYYAKGVRRRPCRSISARTTSSMRSRRGAAPSVFACLARRRRKTRRRPGGASEACPSISIASASVSPRRRAGMTPPPPEFDAVLETITKEAAAFRDLPGPLRGETRERITAQARRARPHDARRRARARRSRRCSGDARRGRRAAASVPRSHARRDLSARDRLRRRSLAARARAAADGVVRIAHVRFSPRRVAEALESVLTQNLCGSASASRTCDSASLRQTAST